MKSLSVKSPRTSIRGRLSGSLVRCATPGSVLNPARKPHSAARRRRRSSVRPKGAAKESTERSSHCWSIARDRVNSLANSRVDSPSAPRWLARWLPNETPSAASLTIVGASIKGAGSPRCLSHSAAWPTRSVTMNTSARKSWMRRIGQAWSAKSWNPSSKEIITGRPTKGWLFARNQASSSDTIV